MLDALKFGSLLYTALHFIIQNHLVNYLVHQNVLLTIKVCGIQNVCQHALVSLHDFVIHNTLL
jgi:hypothetical protein